jgi:hypothetical protein
VFFQLYSAEEKAAVSKSIEILLSYRVRFGLEAEDEEAPRVAFKARAGAEPSSYCKNGRKKGERELG